MNEMSGPLLAAISADLAVPGRWQMVNAHSTLVETSVPDELGVLTLISHRHVTATLSCPARGLSLVFMLEGPANGAADHLKMHYMGTPFETNDAGLIARIDNAVEPLRGLRETELMAKLAEPLS